MSLQSTMSFNAEMAAALWEGRKTQTWRLIRPQPMPLIPPADWPPAKHRIGERLIVKEPWTFSRHDGRVTFDPDQSIDGTMAIAAGMPVSFARQAITITGIRPVRLEDIDEEGAWAEGFASSISSGPARYHFLQHVREIYKLAPDANPWGWRYTFTHERLHQ